MPQSASDLSASAIAYAQNRGCERCTRVTSTRTTKRTLVAIEICHSVVEIKFISMTAGCGSIRPHPAVHKPQPTLGSCSPLRFDRGLAPGVSGIADGTRIAVTSDVH